ncbi:MAG: ATP-binding protein [Cytophagaceae bacterium]|nr:ATP-binding protein [Cytophagaceae bacterium]MDW8455806.1 ATP-binding protein [Cytophagaceae bacterium]
MIHASMGSQIKISCNIGNLKKVRKFVSDTLRKYALSESEINMLVLAVDEICANSIIHANKKDETKNIEVEISEENSGISFSIKDFGSYYDLLNQKEPDIKQLIRERRKGGVGLMLVKKIMDSIEVFQENGHTTYKLFKKTNVNLALKKFT